MKKRKYSGYLAVSEADKTYYATHVQEAFTGQIVDKEIRFPKELGADHPFDFKATQKVFKRIGVINGIINKLKNSIVGDFQVKAKNPNIQAFLNSFIEDTNFSSFLREWIKEGLVKGNGFAELDLDNNRIRVLNANNMYVKRTKKGKVIEYNQWLGMTFRTMNKTSKLLTPFKPNKIAHLKINKIANEAYGIGIIWPSERTITNLVQLDQDLHKLIKRKAGAPIHVKVGVPGENVNTQDIDDYANKLKFMNNRTEWVTDANTEMKVLDFTNLGANLTETMESDMQMLATGVNLPMVFLGKANIPEGLAKAQGEDRQRFIEAIREEIENIIETTIFKPLLLANKFPDERTKGLDKNAVGGAEKVEFIWNLPGEDEINKRIERITELLKGFNLSENMTRMLNLELARLLDFDEAERFLLKPEPGLDQAEKDKEDKFRDEALKSESPEAKEEGKIQQPEVPGAKPGAKSSRISPPLKDKICPKCKTNFNTNLTECPNCKIKLETKQHKTKLIKLKHMKGCGCGQQITEKESALMTIREWCNLKELAGFNYSDYLVRILRRIRGDKFDNLKALTEQDIADGLLSKSQTNKLRFILREGFRKNRTIAEIQKEIDTSLNLKDRLTDGKVTAKKEVRPNSIARTETVRLANAGLLDTYKDNKIEKVRFLAALSERTCPQCEGLNGQVFLLNEAEGLIPVHTMCRCTFTSIE